MILNMSSKRKMTMFLKPDLQNNPIIATLVLWEYINKQTNRNSGQKIIYAESF